MSILKMSKTQKEIRNMFGKLEGDLCSTEAEIT
jgi:hypothetical protein